MKSVQWMDVLQILATIVGLGLAYMIALGCFVRDATQRVNDCCGEETYRPAADAAVPGSAVLHSVLGVEAGGPTGCADAGTRTAAFRFGSALFAAGSGLPLFGHHRPGESNEYLGETPLIAGEAVLKQCIRQKIALRMPVRRAIKIYDGSERQEKFAALCFRESAEEGEQIRFLGSRQKVERSGLEKPFS